MYNFYSFIISMNIPLLQEYTNNLLFKYIWWIHLASALDREGRLDATPLSSGF